MYNKLFTKILDSSVWLESAHTRLVWLTLIAAMDEDGFCQFAAVGNLAARARVPMSSCQAALEILESADKESGNPDNDGRRIERVPGGWIVLNAKAHRDMVTRVVVQAQTRERVRKHRAKRAGNAPVTESNEKLTPSEAYTEAETEKIKPVRRASRFAPESELEGFEGFWSLYPNRKGKQAAKKAWLRLKPDLDLVGVMCSALAWQVGQPQWTKDGGQFVPHAATWINNRRWEDEVITPRLSRSEFFRIHGYYPADES